MVWFLAVIGAISIIVFLYNYRSWKKSRGEERARISFKKFNELYSKKPYQWKLYDDCVLFDSYPFSYTVEFETYPDVLKYKRLYKKVAKKSKKKNGTRTKKILKKR